MARGLTPAGSTARWRRTRLVILARDGMRCRVPLADGHPCGVPLVQHPPGYVCTSAACRRRHAHVDHVIARADYPAGLDPDVPDNLRASCEACNLRRAAEHTNARAASSSAHRWL